MQWTLVQAQLLPAFGAHLRPRGQCGGGETPGVHHPTLEPQGPMWLHQVFTILTRRFVFRQDLMSALKGSGGWGCY